MGADVTIKNPLILELNSFTFLSRMRKKYDEKITLAGLPDEEWQYFRTVGFDYIWLMGVWRRSPASRKITLRNTNLRQAYTQVLPDWGDKDVRGSPFAVYDYTPDRFLGRKADLKIIKEKINNAGLSLILDFVPNHLAIDHPWVEAHPQRFIRATKKALSSHPDWFFRTRSGRYLAYGRDPNFPPWTDTVQVNFFSREMRNALIRWLLKIARVADGVRCDMAMLGMNTVFQQVWGDIFKPRVKLQTEFWEEAITAVKSRYPEFIFIAEVYWGLEGELRKLGFDFTYDKILYDRLRYDKPWQIKEYLINEADNLSQMVHFIENHDEPPACQFFGKQKSLAAAVVTSTVPGMRFFFEGQTDGKQLHIPVQLAREPEETGDEEIKRFYSRLLASCRSEIFHDGKWNLLTVDEAWQGNESYKNLLVWCWSHNEQFKLVAVNYSDVESQGRVRLPLTLDDKVVVKSYDELADATYESGAEEVKTLGLYISLKPWQSHILDITVN